MKLSKCLKHFNLERLFALLTRKDQKSTVLIVANKENEIPNLAYFLQLFLGFLIQGAKQEDEKFNWGLKDKIVFSDVFILMEKQFSSGTSSL